jgi:hypothetical protein
MREADDGEEQEKMPIIIIIFASPAGLAEEKCRKMPDFQNRRRRGKKRRRRVHLRLPPRDSHLETPTTSSRVPRLPAQPASWTIAVAEANPKQWRG